MLLQKDLYISNKGEHICTECIDLRRRQTTVHCAVGVLILVLLYKQLCALKAAEQ